MQICFNLHKQMRFFSFFPSEQEGDGFVGPGRGFRVNFCEKCVEYCNFL